MASFNNCTFSGNVGQDPEIRYFESGTMVAEFSLAVSSRRKEVETLWLRVKVWGKQAQAIGDYVKKGSQIIVNGEFQQETWQKNGQKMSKLVLNCQNFTLLGGKRTEANGNTTKRAPKPAQRTPEPEEDDEVPF
jgi:single-strand DNA-binding protein